MLLATDLGTFLMKGNPDFSNGPKIQPKSSPDCPFLCDWVFETLQSFEIVYYLFIS